MEHSIKLIMLASAGGMLMACEHYASDEAMMDEASVKPMVMAVEAAQVGTAFATIGFKKDDPSKKLIFTSSGLQFCRSNGSCGSAISLNTGDIDLSAFPPGDVGITISIGDDAWNAGYRYDTSNTYNSIAIAVWPKGTGKPTPVFGGTWPETFDTPSIVNNGRDLIFFDKESDQDAYEYSIAVTGPGGRVVLDPKITNGGTGNK